jgi:hypothetical protein
VTAFRSVCVEWLQYGLEPDGTTDLSADDQRHFLSDIYGTEPSLLQDCLAESLARSPAYAAEILEAFRTSDFAQLGSVVDRLMRKFLIGSTWLETELREIQEQERNYDEDE